MTNVQLLRKQLTWAHETMEATIDGVDDTTAHFTETKKALPVGAAYAHAVLAEDMVVSTMLAQKEPLAQNASEAGVSELMPSMKEWEKHERWAQNVKVDLLKLRSFAKKIYQASDDWLASLSDEDIEKEYDLTQMGLGKQTVLFVISGFVILHMANLTGEVSAAKGFQGHKGYPF